MQRCRYVCVLYINRHSSYTHTHTLWKVVLATRKIVRPRALHLIGCCVYVQVAVALLIQRPNPCSLTVLGGRWCFLSLGGRCSGVRGSSDPLLKQRLTRLRTRTRRALITHELTHHLCFDRCDLVLVPSRNGLSEKHGHGTSTFSARWSALVPPMPCANEASLAINAGSGDDEACLQYCMRASSNSFPLNISAIVLKTSRTTKTEQKN